MEDLEEEEIRLDIKRIQRRRTTSGDSADFGDQVHESLMRFLKQTGEEQADEIQDTIGLEFLLQDEVQQVKRIKIKLADLIKFDFEVAAPAAEE